MLNHNRRQSNITLFVSIRIMRISFCRINLINVLQKEMKV